MHRPQVSVEVSYDIIVFKLNEVVFLREVSVWRADLLHLGLGAMTFCKGLATITMHLFTRAFATNEDVCKSDFPMLPFNKLVISFWAIEVRKPHLKRGIHVPALLTLLGLGCRPAQTTPQY